MTTGLHVHDDISEAARWYRIPLALWYGEDVYILQDDRLVFIGSRAGAVRFLKNNEGEICDSLSWTHQQDKQAA